jgi:hypothetical protein
VGRSVRVTMTICRIVYLFSYELILVAVRLKRTATFNLFKQTFSTDKRMEG